MKKFDEIISDRLLQQIKFDEGYRKFPYIDSVGKWTVGYGRNISDVPLTEDELIILGIKDNSELFNTGITETQASYLLEQEVISLYKILNKSIPWISSLSSERRDVLINMGYNLGAQGILKFKPTLDLIKNGNYIEAGIRLKRTPWYRQVGKRAVRLIKQLETGEYAANVSGVSGSKT